MIRDADHLSMTEMAAALTEVSQKARSGQIGLDDLQGEPLRSQTWVVLGVHSLHRLLIHLK